MKAAGEVYPGQFTKNLLQVDIELDPNVIDSIKTGTILAFEHCRNVFRWERWNCPTEDFERHKQQRANKELAFTQAITAAGIVHAVTKNCSRGEISDCGCNSNFGGTTNSQKVDPPSSSKQIELNTNVKDKTVKWSWGGCSDDSTYGLRLVRDLLENSKENATVLSYIEKHNYRLGKQIVQQAMIKKCRCHGVSGSCSLQTCWMQLPPFHIISKKLKEKYRKARRLISENIEATIALGNSVKREDRTSNFLAPEDSLVFLEQSLDYCLPDQTQNWPGTKGRFCSRTKSNRTTASEKRSCRNLCRQCGYKVRREKMVVRKRCNCVFQWCCSVKCEMCSEIVEELYCD
ncbi:unnamed protein product [Ceutorhynchus assimilis]|uniref:Protein Wnt n=1 Tax=Ceutorhynchus assimilis TaxID=467358 RepID=A0A9P0DJI7_9CUCU|nr:unnamed protein product [Ceutorhynchus assimilis]